VRPGRDVGTLIAARGVQGLGAALMTPQTLAFITFLFPPAHRGAAMGLWGGIAGLATVTGPLLGGLLVDNLGWQWIFFVNVPVGVVAVVMTMILVPDWRPHTAHSFDVPGILLSGPGCCWWCSGCRTVSSTTGRGVGWHHRLRAHRRRRGAAGRVRRVAAVQPPGTPDPAAGVQRPQLLVRRARLRDRRLHHGRHVLPDRDLPADRARVDAAARRPAHRPDVPAVRAVAPFVGDCRTR